MRTTTASQDFIRGIWKENPVLIQLLGLCPALAVTNSVANALAMSGATFFVPTEGFVALPSAHVAGGAWGALWTLLDRDRADRGPC